jgi:prephenate dehydrogenase
LNTVAIFGVGLIGGSFALALRHAGFQGSIIGVSSASTIERALALRVIDSGADAESAASQADLIYLAQPISEILNCLTQLNPWVRSDALVTDAGSTKSTITEYASRHLRRCQFLGGHPLAGKETTGVSSAEPQLFQGRKYVVTPRNAEELNTPEVGSFLSWLDRIGAVRVVMDAAQHDRTVAYTSHLPQLAATALAVSLKSTDPNTNVFGPGLLDMTRLAMSPFSVWKDILQTNSREIRDALESYLTVLHHFKEVVATEDMQREFDNAADLARQLRGYKSFLDEK